MHIHQLYHTPYAIHLAIQSLQAPVYSLVIMSLVLDISVTEMYITTVQLLKLATTIATYPIAKDVAIVTN